MKEKFAAASSVIVVFLFGCLFGSYVLWTNLRLNGLEADYFSFKKGVDQFAKQINGELAKRPIKEK